MDKEEFLTIAEGYYEEFDSLKKAPNFYEYEKTFDTMRITVHLYQINIWCDNLKCTLFLLIIFYSERNYYLCSTKVDNSTLRDWGVPGWKRVVCCDDSFFMGKL